MHERKSTGAGREVLRIEEQTVQGSTESGGALSEKAWGEIVKTRLYEDSLKQRPGPTCEARWTGPACWPKDLSGGALPIRKKFAKLDQFQKGTPGSLLRPTNFVLREEKILIFKKKTAG